MILTGEDLPAIHQVTQKHVAAVFDESDFGKFLVLARNENDFLQTACLWEPNPECNQFLQRTESLPYSLEYKDKSTGEMFAAQGWLTLQEIQKAFSEFLRGTDHWKQNKVWTKLEY